MNVLILNGSPRINGNTSIAIREMEKAVLPAGHVQKRANAYSMTW